MSHAALASLLGPEFDDFLYASIDEDRNGKPLSVLSALARLEVDPWREAVKLARLPKEDASKRLAALIAAQPDEPSAHRPVQTIAARLIAVLPQGGGLIVQPRKTSPGASGMSSSRPITLVVVLILMLIAFFGLLIRSSSTPGDNTPPASSISAVSRPALPTVPGIP